MQHDRIALRRFLPCALASLALTACIEPFETPSAYTDQRYLCDDAFKEEWEAARAECIDENHSEGECGGIISFDGILEGRPVTIETKFRSTVIWEATVGDATLISDTKSDGKTPYFDLSVKAKSFGVSVDEPFDEATFDLNSNAENLDDPLADNKISFDLRLNTGGESIELQGRSGSGHVRLSRPEDGVLDATFEGEFGEPGNRITGCLVLLSTETRKL